MRTVLRGAVVLGSALLITGLAAPTASAAPAVTVASSVSGVTAGATLAPKRCYKIVKLRSGKKVKRWYTCGSVRKVAAAKGYANTNAGCRAFAFSYGTRFGITPGTGPRPGNPSSDHNRGMAWDFMVRGSKGTQLANALRADPRTKYVLWQVPAHYDHVHLSCR